MTTESDAPKAYCIHDEDNVAVLMEDVLPGLVILSGSARVGEVKVLEPIKMGHKMALKEFEPGHAVIKYGIRIGHATQFIAKGSWVHLHNCASDYDEGSSRLDHENGVPLDARYE